MSESIVTKTKHLDLIDCQAAMSKGLFTLDQRQLHLRAGEFCLEKPYFQKQATTFQDTTANEDSTNHQQTRKPKRRKTTYSPSVTDIETEQQHDAFRPFLETYLAELGSIIASQTNKDTSAQQSVKNDNKEEEPVFDFTSLTELASAATRFAMPQQEDENDVEIEHLNQEISQMDLLNVYSRIIENTSSYCKYIQFESAPDQQQTYMIPPRSAFLMSDMALGFHDLTSYAKGRGGFDLIVMDPPWPNKSVHRSSHYETQDIYDLFQLPIPDLLCSDKTRAPLVAVWVTNKPKFHRFVKDKLFKQWGLTHAATWLWLKVTTAGEPVIPLDSTHRKPYEQLIIGRPNHVTVDGMQPPTQHMIVSVPCKRHSRKPPLEDILSPYVTKEPRCLEMFARCLTPNWVSWGNECLRFQHMMYFDKTDTLPSTPNETSLQNQVDP